MEKVKIKNEYFEIMNANSEIIKNLLNKDLPIKLSYWISKIFKKLESSGKHYFEVKNTLIKKHAKEEPTDGMTEIQLIDPEEFMKELRELQEIEIEIDSYEIDLDDLEGINIKPIEITLMPFITIKE